MLFKINHHKIWQTKGIINLLLLPFSLIWIFLAKLRTFKKTYHSNIFVICVGNLNIGGSGKTPTALKLASLLKEHGYNVCFLNKGYKGTIKKTTWVNTSNTPKEVGDEALLLNQVAPTLVSNNLVKGLKLLDKNKKYDMVILDDGLQNPTALKHFSIVVVNGHYLFGNKMIFPAGPLRETVKKGLSKANSIVLLEHNNIKFKKECYKHNINVYDGFYKASKQLNINQKYIAFCAIGMPSKFSQSLNNIYINPLETIAFPDHYEYQEKDIQELIDKAKKANAKLITTSKDFVKINNKYSDIIEVLDINLELTNHEQLIKEIIEKYNETKNQASN